MTSLVDLLVACDCTRGRAIIDLRSTRKSVFYLVFSIASQASREKKKNRESLSLQKKKSEKDWVGRQVALQISCLSLVSLIFMRTVEKRAR